jgi:hypothetical protein
MNRLDGNAHGDQAERFALRRTNYRQLSSSGASLISGRSDLVRLPPQSANCGHCWVGHFNSRDTVIRWFCELRSQPLTAGQALSRESPLPSSG